MANIKSAKKANRQAIKRAKRNKAFRLEFKKGIKSLVKRGGSGIDTKDFSKVQAIIDKSSKGRIIHPNKAARLKSKLAKKVKTNIAS